MNRYNVDRVKTLAQELLHRIEVMERCAGWTRYTTHGNEATSTPHPDDSFCPGGYSASVKRASMDLSRALVDIRR